MFKITLLYESIKVTQRLPTVDMVIEHAAQVIATVQQTVAARYNIEYKSMQHSSCSLRVFSNASITTAASAFSHTVHLVFNSCYNKT